MKMSFRWYGKDDPVTLQYISQIPGMRSVVSAVYSVAPGKVWSNEDIREIADQAASYGLVFDIVESVPVHEDIKLGKPSRDEYIAVYCENIRRLAKVGVKVICYNFMPVFDWLRSDLGFVNPDGSTSLIYRDKTVLDMDPRAGDLSLPGWDASYTKEGLGKLLEEYKAIDEEALWDNLKYFLEGIIPTCEECDVKMAIHPDDPPWGIFGLPRIVTNEENLDRLLRLVDSPYNGLTLCTGSLGVNPENDIPHMIRRFGSEGRIHFLHARNIKWTGERDFNETAHKTECGSLDMFEIIKAAHDVGFDGYIRPDHGRMIWGEKGRPGYGLYDRALGAVYLGGLWEACERFAKNANQIRTSEISTVYKSFIVTFFALDAIYRDQPEVELGNFLSGLNPFLFEGERSAITYYYHEFKTAYEELFQDTEPSVLALYDFCKNYVSQNDCPEAIQAFKQISFDTWQEQFHTLCLEQMDLNKYHFQ